MPALINNPYSRHHPLWIGNQYSTSLFRNSLILGESTFAYNAEDPDDTQWIRYWINKAIVQNNIKNKANGAKLEELDKTFCRLHWFTSDPVLRGKYNYSSLYYATESAKLEAWFNQLAFINFVTEPVGLDNDWKVTDGMLVAARRPLKLALEELKPKAVWVMGKRQVEYSLDVLLGFGIPMENIEIMTPHPAMILSNVDGLASAARFLAILKRLNG
jgi:hypothetical protein